VRVALATRTFLGAVPKQEQRRSRVQRTTSLALRAVAIEPLGAVNARWTLTLQDYLVDTSLLSTSACAALPLLLSRKETTWPLFLFR